MSEAVQFQISQKLFETLEKFQADIEQQGEVARLEKDEAAAPAQQTRRPADKEDKG